MVLENLENKVKYVDPDKKTYTEYFDSIVAFNRKLQEEISADIINIFGKKEDGYTISTTGSDARLEKGPQSRIEIILFSDKYCNCNDIIHTLSEYTKNKEHVSIFEDYIEIKELDDEMYYYILNKGLENEIRVHSPNRILDSKLIFGNYNIFQEAKKKLVTEFDSEKFRKIKERTKSHLRTTLSGIQEYNKDTTLTHFDLQSGVTHYNPENRLWSFKQGPIRAVQYAIVRDILRESLDHPEISNSLLNLPQNTVEKLNYLEVSGMTERSHGEINDLTDCYKYFIWQYHRSQKHYNSGVISTEFNVQEVKERLNSLEAICKNKIIQLNEITGPSIHQLQQGSYTLFPEGLESQ